MTAAWSYPEVPHERCNQLSFNISGALRHANITRKLWTRTDGTVGTGSVPRAYSTLIAWRVRNTNYTSGSSAQLDGESWGRRRCVLYIDGFVYVLLSFQEVSGVFLYVYDAATGARHYGPTNILSEFVVFSTDGQYLLVASDYSTTTEFTASFKRIDADGNVTTFTDSSKTKTGPITFGFSKGGELVTLARRVEDTTNFWAVYVYDGTTQTEITLPDNTTAGYKYLAFSDVTNKAYVMRFLKSWYEIDIDALTATALAADGTVEIPQGIGLIKGTAEDSFWTLPTPTSHLQRYDITKNASDNVVYDKAPSAIDSSYVRIFGNTFNTDPNSAADSDNTIMIAATDTAIGVGVVKEVFVIKTDGTKIDIPDFAPYLITGLTRYSPARGVWIINGNFDNKMSEIEEDGCGRDDDVHEAFDGLSKFSLNYTTSEWTENFRWQTFAGLQERFDEGLNFYLLNHEGFQNQQYEVGSGEYHEDQWRKVDISQVDLS